MAELVPAPFASLVTRLFREPATQDTVFDLHRRGWYVPRADGPDFSVRFHSQRAGNPAGPASGPHTQMAQNILLCYAAGSRIIELKTVQVNDRLTIPRPCIDMTNIGYNIEWSQELRVEESLREYVAGMMLVEMWRHLGPVGGPGLAGQVGEVIYDISLGYDLAGIRSDKISRFLDGLRDTQPLVERLRAEIPQSFTAARRLDYPRCLSATVTLSTFHGCPADEIESICEYLVAERDLDVVVKMNPPMLGRERLEHLLHEVMGYDDIRVNPAAYTTGLQFDEAVQLVDRLTRFAQARGHGIGCKFSNTLEVINHRSFFPPGNEVMYLSGAPLHVITLALADKFRRAVGPAVPFSFSAGVDQHNFADVVASGFVPVTTCTDLLKPGGYGRLPLYLRRLEEAMEEHGAKDIASFIVARAGGGMDHARAAMANLSTVAAAARDNPRYRADKNRTVPKRIQSQLETFDCITCDKCVPVCPNDANFTYPLAAVDMELHDILVEPSGEWRLAPEPRRLTIARKHQIANYADFCNECGNCDTFCPEYGGPFIRKPNFFGSASSYEAAAPRDGFVITGGVEAGDIRGRIQGHEFVLQVGNGSLIFDDGRVTVRLESDTFDICKVTPHGRLAAPHRVDFIVLHTLRLLRLGVMDMAHINQVNASLAS
jgi:putative selenate reductase